MKEKKESDFCERDIFQMQYAIELKIIFKAKVFVLIFETINFLTRMCLRRLTRDIMICNFETVSSIRVKHYATIYL